MSRRIWDYVWDCPRCGWVRTTRRGQPRNICPWCGEEIPTPAQPDNKKERKCDNMGNLEPKEYDRYEQIKEALGADTLLEEFINALPNDTVLDTLEYIARVHEIPEEDPETDQ